jgi:L-alanine-DL-glutamate epimerase-like enolase superfamily enzyme
MRIIDVQTQLFEFTMPRRLGDVNSPQGRSEGAAMITRIDTDQGVSGISLHQPGARASVENLKNLIIGEDPRGVVGLWQRMVDSVFKGGNRGIVTDAIAAIDVALWDLKAKLQGEPLWRTLGALSPRVKAYASDIGLCLSDEELRAFYREMAALGVTAGKVKVGLDAESDLRRLGIVYKELQAAAARPALMIDANEYWSPKQAVRRVREIEEHFDLTWVEEPARRWDYAGLKKVSDGVKAAVATGENLDEIGEFLPLLEHRAADVLNIGISTSGITGAMQVAHMAHGFETPVTMMNTPGNFMAHLAAALPNHTMMEVVFLESNPVFAVDTRIDDGWIILGEQPGLGIEIDAAALAEHEVQEVSRDTMASPWGRRPGAGLFRD